MARLRLFVAWLVLCHVLFIAFGESGAHAQDERAKLVKEDLANFDQDEYWIYDDLESGVAKARETGRPLLVVFR